MPKTHKSARDYRAGTNRRRIAELCDSGATKQVCFETLKSLIQTGEMEFTRNPDREAGETRRMALPLPAQYDALRHEIGRVYALLGRAKGSKFESEEIPQEEQETQDEIPQTQEEEEQEDETQETQDEEEIPQDEKPQAKGKQRLKDEWKKFVSGVHKARRFCLDRKRLYDEDLDSVGYRWMEHAASLIAAGIPADVLLCAATMHWPAATRAEAGIDDFDFWGDGVSQSHPGMLAVSQRVMRERGINPQGKHELFGYLLLLVENRVPVLVVGPAGTGKSFILKQLADYMSVEYGETPMSAGASRGDLLGRHTISQEVPFIVSEFQNRYTTGGIFAFEELDRSAPEVLIPLHNALASDEMFNSVSGQKLEKDAGFIPAATGNTFGLGANRAYTTGERLDAATLDRFRMGRVFLPVDETMEEDVFTRKFLANL